MNRQRLEDRSNANYLKQQLTKLLPSSPSPPTHRHLDSLAKSDDSARVFRLGVDLALTALGIDSKKLTGVIPGHCSIGSRSI